MATDISPEALNMGKKNAAALGLKDKIDFRLGNLFEPVNGIFDIIVCNPPYISAQDYKELPAGVKIMSRKTPFWPEKADWNFTKN